MCDAGPTAEYLRKHDVEATLKAMLDSLRVGRPANPFAAMAAFIGRASQPSAASKPPVYSPLTRLVLESTPGSPALSASVEGSPLLLPDSPPLVPELSQEQWRLKFQAWKQDPNRGMAPGKVPGQRGRRASFLLRPTTDSVLKLQQQ